LQFFGEIALNLDVIPETAADADVGLAFDIGSNFLA
jgi:hypothetical protein